MASGTPEYTDPIGWSALEVELNAALEHARTEGVAGPGLLHVQPVTEQVSLNAIGSRLAELVRPADLAVHRGDGSIVLLLPRVRDRDLIAVAQRLARRLRDDLHTNEQVIAAGLCMSWPSADAAELIVAAATAAELASIEGVPFVLHEHEGGDWAAMEVARLTEQLRVTAETDELTGLRNRRALLRTLGHVFEPADRPTGVLFIDLDQFGRINKLMSNRVGDDVLREVGALLQHVAAPAPVFRLGGEEFVVLATEAQGDPIAFAEHLRVALVEAAIPHPGNPPWDVVTASIGVDLPRRRDDLNDAIDLADAAMRTAKATGKNRVQLSARRPVSS